MGFCVKPASPAGRSGMTQRKNFLANRKYCSNFIANASVEIFVLHDFFDGFCDQKVNQKWRRKYKTAVQEMSFYLFKLMR